MGLRGGANTAQSLTFVFPETVTGGTLHVTFAYDNKAWFASRDFAVETSTDGATWQTLAHPTANADHTFACPLPKGAIRAVRITQSPGGGSEARPNLIGVQQVARVP